MLDNPRGSIFIGDPGRQITPEIWGNKDMIKVTVLDSAKAALKEIVVHVEAAQVGGTNFEANASKTW